jgi:hypothetical protein
MESIRDLQARPKIIKKIIETRNHDGLKVAKKSSLALED